MLYLLVLVAVACLVGVGLVDYWRWVCCFLFLQCLYVLGCGLFWFLLVFAGWLLRHIVFGCVAGVYFVCIVLLVLSVSWVLVLVLDCVVWRGVCD